MGTGARPDTGTGTRGRDEDGLRRRRAELLAAGGPGARLDAAGLRAALTDLYEDELRTLGEQIAALLMPLQRRTFDGEAPADARLVDVFTYLLPRPEDRRA